MEESKLVECGVYEACHHIRIRCGRREVDLLKGLDKARLHEGQGLLHFEHDERLLVKDKCVVQLSCYNYFIEHPCIQDCVVRLHY
jgi:hypothetical protein